MCGIVGLYAQSAVNQDIYDALTVLQHRGQDAAGIVTEEDGKFYLRKSNGLVRDVFHTRHMKNLRGNLGIGHVRYPTAGSSSCAEAQPLYVNSPYGIVLAHNGNLTNQTKLAEELFETDHRHLNTSSDSEVLLNILANELQIRNKVTLDKEDIFSAIESLHARCSGAYAVLAAISGHGMIAFRDPNGIRPLIMGERTARNGKKEFMFSSESVALDCLGFENSVDIKPGEIVYVDEQGTKTHHISKEAKKATPCIFEYIYFARPDSIIDGSSVYKARVRMGEYLANKIKREWPDHDIDVVIPVPESSRPSAMELAVQLGVKFREGFIKNRYIGRTFIMPGQEERKKSVKQKLNPIDLEFHDKNVLLVDDSIVRGTTSQQIVDMARQAGAKKVYFASAAPPIRYPNVYGIDMPVKSELVAHGKNQKQICDEIGADKLIYQDLADVITAVIPSDEENSTRQFDCSVFDGQYVTNDIDEAYLDNLKLCRSDAIKKQIIDVDINDNNVDVQEVL